MNTEGGRISHILQNAKRCSINENLARARQFIGGDSCVSCKNVTNTNKNIQSENAYLISHLDCYNYVKQGVVPESVRIARVIQDTLDKEIDPLNPTTRFIDYAPAATNIPCPLIQFNANVVARRCVLLPNTPLNPSFPS